MNDYPIEIAEGGYLRIKNAAVRVNLTIYLVGSRAAGTHHVNSDFDYIIPNIRSRQWDKIKNSLPGARIPQDNVPNRIDRLKTEVDTTRPYIKITP